MKPAWVLALAWVATASVANAETLIEARVRSIAEETIYLEAGRDQGVERGAKVFVPTGSGEVVLRIVAVTRTRSAFKWRPSRGKFPLRPGGLVSVSVGPAKIRKRPRSTRSCHALSSASASRANDKSPACRKLD